MITLRPYQLDVIERASARMREGARRLIIQAPTGAGKTTVSSEIIRRSVAKGKRSLFIAHRRRLIQQKSERLDAFGVEHGIIMAGQSGYGFAPVKVASRDTLLSRSVRNEWTSLPPADLVIVDECHNMGDEYLSLLKMYPDAYIIGLSATPTLPDGRGMGHYYQALECTVPTSQLVREGYLVPVTPYAPERKGCRDKPGLRGDPVTHWRRLAAGRPTVLFAAKVAESLAAMEAFTRAGIPAAHIDAHTEDDAREEIVAQLQAGTISVVCNVGVWTEGVDVPELSCCILYRTCGSYVLFAQAVGRVMRSHPGKTDAILIDHAGAVFEHGFPDEDVTWTLDADDSVDRRKKKAREAPDAKPPICCPNCSLMFSGSITCPSCGHTLPRKMRPAKRRDEILAEVDRQEAAHPGARREHMVRYWHLCLRVMAAKGRTCGSASAMFRQRWGEWPPNDFPNVHGMHQSHRPVSEVFPQYVFGRTA